ncbi:MAG: protein rep [Pseudorhodoplanes sp.]
MLEVHHSPIARELFRSDLRRETSSAIREALKEAALGLTVGREGQRLLKLVRRMEVCEVTQQTRVLRDSDGTSYVARFNRRGCRSRFCVPCTAKNTAHDRKKAHELLDGVFEQVGEVRTLFLTLSSKNRDIDEVADMFNDHDAALRRFWRNSRVQQATLGSFTAFECDVRGTRENPEAGVHSHSVVFVDPAVFSDHRYLRQREWAQIWGQALRVSYRPIVDVRVVRNRDGESGAAAVRAIIPELCKYVIDPGSLVQHDAAGLTANPRVVLALARALHRRRVQRFDRIVAKAARKKRRQPASRSTPNPIPA